MVRPQPTRTHLHLLHKQAMIVSLMHVMHARWGILGLFGFFGLMTALVAMTAMVQNMRRCFGWVPKEEQEEKGPETEMVQMAALGEVAEPREETSFGSPPQGPEVALDLDPNRFSNDVDG